MPFAEPPSGLAVAPERDYLPIGTELWRVHSSYACTSFNPTRAHRYFGGGRFDSTDDDAYAYIYAGPTKQSAVCETLLRDVEFGQSAVRFLSPGFYANRHLSNMTTTVELTLLSLMTATALSCVAQDGWITAAEQREYAQTRHWVHWYRKHIDWAQGVKWPSKRDVGNYAVVLFEDRCPPGCLTAGALTYDFNTSTGRRELEEVLKPLNTVI